MGKPSRPNLAPGALDRLVEERRCGQVTASGPWRGAAAATSRRPDSEEGVAHVRGGR
jgi:hypothetical protein